MTNADLPVVQCFGLPEARRLNYKECGRDIWILFCERRLSRRTHSSQPPTHKCAQIHMLGINAR